MRELSLNILDITENSCKAKAKNVEIDIFVSEKENLLEIIITDDGVGMSEEFLKNVIDPFTTTRTTRKVGMGIPLFKEAAESTGGRFIINSKVNFGTKVYASFGLDHIDRMPLGDIGDTMSILIMGNENVEFVLRARKDEEFIFSTKETKDILGVESLNCAEILNYLKEFIEENIQINFGGRI